MMGDVQMRHRIELQNPLKQLPVELQELARIWGAGIGDYKTDIEIVRISSEPLDEALLRQVHRKGSVINLEIGRDTASHFLKQSFSSGHKH
jgi:hypothetical protein